MELSVNPLCVECTVHMTLYVVYMCVRVHSCIPLNHQEDQIVQSISERVSKNSNDQLVKWHDITARDCFVLLHHKILPFWTTTLTLTDVTRLCTNPPAWNISKKLITHPGHPLF